VKDRRLQIAAAAAIVVVVVAVWFLARQWLQDLISRDVLERWIGQLGPFGPLGIIVAEILQVLLAPVPGQVVGIAAGYLYGVLWGTLLCMVGLALGSALAMWLARRLGRPFVERLASPELLERIDDYARRRGAIALLFIFLIPFLPDDTVCFIAGLTPLPILELVLLAFVGRAPGIVVSTIIGAQAEELSWLQLTAIGVVSLILALAVYVYRDKLEQAMFRLVDWILGR
jgi:uncharacterized membrane protein YdjX (TVP38/TMEM64 family)